MPHRTAFAKVGLAMLTCSSRKPPMLLAQLPPYRLFGKDHSWQIFVEVA
jgi:hypothetical protein